MKQASLLTCFEIFFKNVLVKYCIIKIEICHLWRSFLYKLVGSIVGIKYATMNNIFTSVFIALFFKNSTQF